MVEVLFKLENGVDKGEMKGKGEEKEPRNATRPIIKAILHFSDSGRVRGTWSLCGGYDQTRNWWDLSERVESEAEKKKGLGLSIDCHDKRRRREKPATACCGFCYTAAFSSLLK
ncbi:hypothetical protein H6P81_002493 [Aristolochia fimbriata]|uniref:Uncharacterized protein n=1 Tax=Aristolochia fimbriata TaxID=158543 RepID=A0AAV7F9Y0_ARIFI|nr:hypothetical protein H6P81_002493 [Aristolochia fimbriata]